MRAGYLFYIKIYLKRYDAAFNKGWLPAYSAVLLHGDCLSGFYARCYAAVKVERF